GVSDDHFRERGVDERRWREKRREQHPEEEEEAADRNRDPEIADESKGEQRMSDEAAERKSPQLSERVPRFAGLPSWGIEFDDGAIEAEPIDQAAKHALAFADPVECVDHRP